MRRRRLIRNRAIERNFADGAMINGQRLGYAADMRYGLCRMSFNGCECIAVYNALVYLNDPQPLSGIAYCLERYKMLFGIFGCNPYRTAKVLGMYGAAFERTEDISKDGAYILSFWTGFPLLSTIHTVFCTVEADGITVYNRYGNCPEPRIFGSAIELLGNRKPIAAYRYCSEK